MRTRIGIKLRKSPTMCITVSMKSAEFYPNPYSCTHQSNDSAEATTHCTHISQESATPPKILRFFSTKEAKKLRFRWQASPKCTFPAAFRECPVPICRLRAERCKEPSGFDNFVNDETFRQQCRNVGQAECLKSGSAMLSNPISYTIIGRNENISKPSSGTVK